MSTESMDELGLQALTLRELLNSDDSSLFVVNNTKPAGELLMNIPSAKGRDQTLKIPVTWVPFDLTTQVRREDILDSPDFRKGISAGYVIAVSTESADKLFENDDGARTELQRILGRGDMAELMVNRKSAKLPTSSDIKNKIGQVSGAAVNSTVTPKVLQTITRANAEDETKLSPNEAISVLRGTDLKESDLQYIVQNASAEQLKDWAAKKLNGGAAAGSKSRK